MCHLAIPITQGEVRLYKYETIAIYLSVQIMLPEIVLTILQLIIGLLLSHTINKERKTAFCNSPIDYHYYKNAQIYFMK